MGTINTPLWVRKVLIRACLELAGGRLRDEGEVERNEVSAPSSGGWGREREIKSPDQSGLGSLRE